MVDANKQRFEQAIDFCQLTFDAFVDNGSDEELFLSSYLCGHFDLIVGQAFINSNYSLEDLNTKLLESLMGAFDDDNLSTEEQRLLLNLWQGLYLTLND